MAKERKPRTIPRFTSDDEERLFWDTHDPSLYFTEPADIVIELDSSKKKRVSLQIDAILYETLKHQAEEQGVRYQQLMRDILTDALSRPHKPGHRARKPSARKATPAAG